MLMTNRGGSFAVDEQKLKLPDGKEQLWRTYPVFHLGSLEGLIQKKKCTKAIQRIRVDAMPCTMG